MKKFFLVLILNIFLIYPSYSESIDMFCLIDRYVLEKAKLDKKEYGRFAGKVIKLNINFEENIIYDVSEDDQVSVITGIDQFGIAFTGDINKINYKNEFDIKGNNQKIIKYKYKNEMFIFDDRRTGSFKSRITQSGLISQ